MAPSPRTRLRAIVHASELLTGAGVAARDGRRPVEADLGRVPDGAIVYRERRQAVPGGSTRWLPDTVEWVGATRALPAAYRKVPRRDLGRRQAIIPGLVDCHTHLVFAGDRSDEFARRCGGATYQEIASGGGGILASVRATRAATLAQLVESGARRLREVYAHGVRTIEIKSGYGLERAAELKILRAVARLRALFPEMTIHATFLGAHAFPPPSEIGRAQYLQALRGMVDEVARRGLADTCDVFVDEGYFTVQEGRELLEHARARGMSLKLHADELGDTGSAACAAELGALSADHLLRINSRGIAALAASPTVAVLLPGTAFYLKAAHAPARALIEAGACVAIATDFNPGTCVCLSLPAVMTIAALYLGLTRAELFAAVTYNAAKALGLQDRKGALAPGRDADFAILPYARFEELYYNFAAAPSVLDGL